MKNSRAKKNMKIKEILFLFYGIKWKDAEFCGLFLWNSMHLKDRKQMS